MKKEDLTVEELNYWQDRMEQLREKGFTKKEWCDLGHEIMEKHGLSQNDALSILRSRSVF